MPIKDKEYWKEYNQKRREYLTQKKREGRTKLKMSTTTPPLSTTEPLKVVDRVVDIPQVVDKNIEVVDTKPKKEVVDQKKNMSTTQEKIIQPIEELIQPPKCPRCPEIENSISEFTNLYQQEQEKNKELTKELKNSQQAIQASQKSCQEARKVISDYQGIIKELQKPINPTIEHWKTDYFNLEKKTNQQLSEQQTTINRLKDKLREKDKEKSEWEQKYRRIENISKNTTNSLSMTNLDTLITKHIKIQNSQHKYTEKDVQEREFLKSLLDKLWSFTS